MQCYALADRFTYCWPFACPHGGTIHVSDIKPHCGANPVAFGRTDFGTDIVTHTSAHHGTDTNANCRANAGTHGPTNYVSEISSYCSSQRCPV